jgi:hypothetical protein
MSHQMNKTQWIHFCDACGVDISEKYTKCLSCSKNKSRNKKKGRIRVGNTGIDKRVKD